MQVISPLAAISMFLLFSVISRRGGGQESTTLGFGQYWLNIELVVFGPPAGQKF